MSAAPSLDPDDVPIAPSAPEPRPTIASHRAVCIPCRTGFPCDVGAELEREAAELVERARARRERDARIARGERVTDVDPPYSGKPVLAIGRVLREEAPPRWRR